MGRPLAQSAIAAAVAAVAALAYIQGQAAPPHMEASASVAHRRVAEVVAARMRVVAEARMREPLAPLEQRGLRRLCWPRAVAQAQQAPQAQQARMARMARADS